MGPQKGLERCAGASFIGQEALLTSDTGERPYVGYGELGEGYGMPSSHTQAAAFLVAWGVGYAMTLDRRRETDGWRGLVAPSPTAQSARDKKRKETAEMIQRWRTRIYLFGLVLWSSLVAYSRYALPPVSTHL